MLGALVATLGLDTASAVNAVGHAMQHRQGGGGSPADYGALNFVRGLEFKHHLRICNAYPFGAALDVYRGQAQKLTGDRPMPYKSCRDFVSPFKAGDKLDFRLGDASAGVFSVAELPDNDAILLLVIHRHDVASTAVAFESHVFAKLLNAQIAVIDTYKGSARALPEIADSGASPVHHRGPERKEELKYDSVVAVNPGVYNVDLKDPSSGKVKARRELVALSRESYVLLRTGVEGGDDFPEELVVYPHSEASELPQLEGAGRPQALPSACLLSLLVWSLSSFLPQLL